MKVEKVKLPREVAEAIEKLECEKLRPFQIVCKVHEGKDYDDRVSVLRKYAIDNDNKLMHALVNGYEVEQTPEDKVLKYYEDHADKYAGRIAILSVLGMLDIKIKGVND